jgi:hypothetical protein
LRTLVAGTKGWTASKLMGDLSFLKKWLVTAYKILRCLNYRGRSNNTRPCFVILLQKRKARLPVRVGHGRAETLLKG